MKRAVLFIVIVLLCNLQAYTSRATSAVAGNITYSWLADSTYRVVFKLYNDCSGSSAPNSVTLCVYNSCNSTGFSTTMQKLNGNIRANTPNGSEVSIGCANVPTKCSSTTSTLPGLHEWWYVDTVTLPARCTSWKFRVALSTRNTTGNLAAGNMLLEATLNNQLSLQNSSPTPSAPLIIFACLNQPISLNLGFTDADNDSLAYVIVTPKTTSNLTCPTAPANIGFKQNTPPIDTINNPIQSSNSFNMSKTNGQIAFTNILSADQVFTVRVDEYRNGVLIGSVLTDVQVSVFACANLVPIPITSSLVKDSIKGGAIGIGGNIEGCVGTSLDYYFPVKSTDTATRYFVSDNGSTTLPNATITYVNQGTDSVSVHLSILPTIGDAGIHSLTFTIKDSTCRPPGIVYTYSWPFRVNIVSGLFIGSDTAVCANEPIKLSPKSPPGFISGTYVWQVLSGSSGTLSCTAYRQPWGWATPTASFVLTSSVGWCQSSYTDTINVSTLSTPVSYPSINITVAPDSFLYQHTVVTYTAQMSGCNSPSYQWKRNGLDIIGSTTPVFSIDSRQLIYGDVISCELTCADSCAQPRDTASNNIRMYPMVSVNNANINDATVSVYPNPASSILYVDIEQKTATAYKAELTDITGRTVLTSILSGSHNDLAITQLPYGMYILKVYSPEGVKYVGKVTKQ